MIVFLALALVFTIPASATTVYVDINASGTYNGTITVTGHVIPNPGTSQEVDVAVNNPSGVNVLNNVVNVNAADGSYSYSSPAGGSSAWVNGTYKVTVTWGTLTSSYPNSTTFQYGTVSTTTTSSTATGSASTVTTTVSTTVTTTFSTATTVAQPTTLTSTLTTTNTQTVSTIVTGPTVTSTTTVSSATWLYVGIAGIVVALIAGAGAAVMMLRRH